MTTERRSAKSQQTNRHMKILRLLVLLASILLTIASVLALLVTLAGPGGLLYMH